MTVNGDRTRWDRELHEQIWKAIAPLLNAWVNDFAKSGRPEAPEIKRLLEKRETEPGMEVLLLRGMRDHGPTQTRRSEMIKGLVLSVLHPEGFRPMTHAKAARSADVDPKTRQRFYNEAYPNIFPVVSEPDRRRETRRTSIVSPRFALQSPRLRAMGAEALRQFSVGGTIEEPLPHEVRYHTRLTHPIVLEDLRQFQQEALTIIQDSPGQIGGTLSGHGQQLRCDLQRPSDILVMMHANVTGILGAQWFVSRHAETRRAILERTHGVSLSRDDVDKAFGLLRAMYGDEEAAGAVFERAGGPFVREGSWSYAFLLFERVYASPVLTEHVRGAIVGNMGALLRRGGHQEEALVCLRRSVAHHAQAGDGFELFIAIRDLAEALWRHSEPEAREWVVAGLRLAERLSAHDCREAMYNLETMFSRLGMPAYASWAAELKQRGGTDLPREVPG